MQSDDPERRTRVFISYSRKESETFGGFAQILCTELSAAGFDAYLDLYEILPGEDWKARLHNLIARCDTFVFCISPASVQSTICDWETNEAERLGKRVLPVVCIQTQPASIPPRLNRYNHIFLRPTDERTEGMRKLVAAIDTDINWVRLSTWIGERASEWELTGHALSKLLRGQDLITAEAWRDSAANAAGRASQLQLDYVSASRTSATRAARTRLTLAALVAIIAISMAAWALWNRQKALTARDETLQTARAAANTASSFVYRLFGGYRETKAVIDARLKTSLLDDAKSLLDQLGKLELKGEKASREALGAVQIERSDALLHSGDSQGAIHAAREAVELFEGLSRDRPHDYGVQRDTAVAYDRLGSALLAANQPEAAQAAFQAGTEKIDFDYGTFADAAAQLTKAVLLEKLGQLAGEASDWPKAEAYFARSSELRDFLAALPEASAEYKRQRAEGLRLYGSARLRLNDVQKAITLLTIARSELERLTTARKDPVTLRDLGDTLALLAEAYERSNKQTEAAEALLQEQEARLALMRTNPTAETALAYLDANNSMAIHTLLRLADGAAAAQLLQSRVPLPEVPLTEVQRQARDVEESTAAVIRDLAIAVAALPTPSHYSPAMGDILRRLESLVPVSEAIAKWEELNTRLALFVSKRAQKDQRYHDALEIMRAWANELYKRPCETSDRCRQRALTEGQLAWAALLAGEFRLALNAGTSAIQMVESHRLPAMDFVKLNYAHARAFVCKQNQPSMLYDGFSRDEVLTDFRSLQAAGQCAPFMAAYDPSIVCTHISSAMMEKGFSSCP